ncbi:MAG: hypothetical protein JNL01_16320 [Bdellovibrionales bacterium]|nr:hypothetical protein [Bdellovibrionales bacterium]
MKISGFTLVRNGIQFDYPFRESILSLLPLVDELIVNVGVSDDETLKAVQELQRSAPGGSKIQIFESHWPMNDPEKKKGGLILSEQTNLSLDRCTGDWCVYLQADEVFHESDLPGLRQALEEADAKPGVDGILFRYLHFYGSFDVVQETRSAYRREVRAIRRASRARSVGDAQSFRLPDGSKLGALLSKARVFHYGWVRTPEAMKEKTYFMDRLYHGDYSEKDGVPHTGTNYVYKKFWGLRPYRGDHPDVMKSRISSKGWKWDLQASPMTFHWKDIKKVILDGIERLTGYRLFEYRSYRLLGRVK